MKGSNCMIGRRIESDGHFGTVCFHGEVPPTKGVWLGIEWDDQERGKHNGTHEGRHYFNTKHPTSGSFLREKKANFGVSLFEAVKERYGRIEDESAGIIEEEMFVKGEGNQVTTVEVVGAQSINLKQSKLNLLKEVSIRDMYVFGTRDTQDLSHLLTNIRELDISKNLIPSWEEVAKIAAQLHHLTSLNVSENFLEVCQNPENLQSSFTSLRHLYINRMNYTWEQVLRCVPMFPRLSSLHACFNAITTITIPPPEYFTDLEMLNLEGNKLYSWDDVLNFGHLKKLNSLIVSDTGISCLKFPGRYSDKTDAFPGLQSLYINRNNITEWSNINELNRLQKLEEIKIQFNPLMSTFNPETVYELFVAKIENLKVFNRSTVTYGDRKGAEIDYLKMYGKIWLHSGGNQDPSKCKPTEEFNQEHPRYAALVSAYGPPEDSELVVKERNLKSTLIPVFIDSPNVPDRKPISKKLPATMTVQKLRALVQRLYKIHSSDITLTYSSQEVPGIEIDIDNDQRQLSFFSIEEGDTINVKW
ncbi:unnamed protein product [Owenia fusiformis]|uniref:Tubulin-specific chaperone E n=1 Tax=Owenia fusiformis TaxID=6347 RepID=A0A8S4PM14_OWEFU|nr:unnamed protein product [Owenia fusiformis]